MSYRTILVHVDQAPQAARRIDCAIDLARHFDAHLIGAALSGVSRYVLSGSLETGGTMIVEQVAAMRSAAAESLEQFDAKAKLAALASHEHRYMDEDFERGLALQAKYADLLVLTQPDPTGKSAGTVGEGIESLLISSVRPMLVLPFSDPGKPIGGEIVVAWDGSREAARAIASALPFLQQARCVSVLIFNPSTDGDAHGEAPGADLALYLARHGIAVDVNVRWTSMDVGAAILAAAADLGADLLVMGAYGHTRWRELLLGGATRSVLSAMWLPVLLAH